MSYTTLNSYREECYGAYLLLQEMDDQPDEASILANSYQTYLGKILTEINNMLDDLDNVEIYPEDIATFEAMVPEFLKDEKVYHSYL